MTGKGDPLTYHGAAAIGYSAVNWLVVLAMRRRDFITLLGGTAVAWPLAARAQQGGRLPTIGYLGATTTSTQSEMVAAFVGRLRELGWIEGRTVAIEYRWADGRSERL